MAKLITRTFESTKATLMGAKIVNGKPELGAEELIINATFNSVKDCQKWVNKNYKGELLNPYVATIETVEELRGITPNDFYNNSIKLDPVTRKPIDIAEDIEIEEA